MLVSALIHPFRDLILKGVAHPVSCYVGVSLIWLILAGSQVILTGQSFVIPLSVIPFILISSAGLVLYYYGTLSALRRGNMSVYYPIVRSSPIVIVIFSWLALDQEYTLLTLLGIGLMLFGSLMIQKSPGGLLENPKTFALAVLAMVASAIYALSDAAAMQSVAPAPFLFYTYILVTPMLGAIRAWEDRQLDSPFKGVIRGWIKAPWRVLVAGVLSYISYYLVLIAFQLGAEAASVSSVRQASIPVSVILAAILLRESNFLRRISWASLLAVGIVLITIS
mgnify:FL=1